MLSLQGTCSHSRAWPCEGCTGPLSKAKSLAGTVQLTQNKITEPLGLSVACKKAECAHMCDTLQRYPSAVGWSLADTKHVPPCVTRTTVRARGFLNCHICRVRKGPTAHKPEHTIMMISTPAPKTQLHTPPTGPHTSKQVRQRRRSGRHAAIPPTQHTTKAERAERSHC